MRTLLTFSVVLIFAALARAEAPSYANADVEGFEKLTKQEGIIVLDVRTPAEFAAGHLANAQFINVQDKDFAEKIAKLDKTKAYAVYCRSGRRSVTACEQMAKLEFLHLTNLVGGIEAWKTASKPIVMDSAK